MKIVLPVDRPKYETALADGRRLTLSPVVKTDRQFFERALDELSIESKFARFGQGVASLSERELDYLTDVDQRHHVAWGAVVEDAGAGVGRYIVSGSGGCPEVAVTVVDALQGQGIGRMLLIALIAVARHDGIDELCFEARSDNRAVLNALADLEVTPLVSGDHIERRLRVSDLPTSSHEEGLVAAIDEARSQASGSSSSSSEAEFTQ